MLGLIFLTAEFMSASGSGDHRECKRHCEGVEYADLRGGLDLNVGMERDHNRPNTRPSGGSKLAPAAFVLYLERQRFLAKNNAPQEH